MNEPRLEFILGEDHYEAPIERVAEHIAERDSPDSRRRTPTSRRCGR
jgi:hypothetical protein